MSSGQTHDSLIGEARKNLLLLTMTTPITVRQGINVRLAGARVALSRACDGMILVYMGYASKDSGATTGFRLDGQFAIHQTEALTHADQAEPATIDRVPPIETNS
jgi:hypothetical protein